RDPFTIARVAIQNGLHHADPAHPAALLRPRRKRPRRSRCAEKGEEGPALHGLAFHSITSSARTSNAVGKVRPSALAALMLMTSSILVTCWTGNSEGLAPLRIRAV